MKRYVIFLVIILFFGCYSSNKPKKPNNLIPKAKMADILYDVFILNAAKGSNKSILEKQGIYPESYVFEKYNIDSLQFALSNEYYGFYVEDYESIIESVKRRIDKDKVTYKALAEKEEKDKQRKRDSIRELSDSTKVKAVKKPIKKKERVDYKSYADEDKSSK
nr:DUF4296 domain-containing protein [uncultured Psychroserpens sp.]